MKKLLVKLFNIKQYYYVTAIGFLGHGDNCQMKGFSTSHVKCKGELNIKTLENDIAVKHGYDSINITGIISISKNQYIQLIE